MSIILTILIFCVIVVIHEWGHFITAKKSGVEVPEFAVGMGPKIWSVKKNGTEYSFRLLPIGGFCRMKGENSEEGSGSFVDAPLKNRMIIICAGAFMNLVLAVFVFTVISSVTPIPTTVIESFSENSPSKEIGLKEGDKIVNINNKAVWGRNDISFAMYDYKGGAIPLKVRRENKTITYYIKPVKSENGNYILGLMLNIKAPMIGKDVEGMERANIGEVLYDGIYNTFFSVRVTIEGLLRLVTSQISVKEVSGPIGLTTVVDEVYNESIQYGIKSVIINILQIMGLLSANLCVMNLLPLPALDGGRFVFLLYEGISGKPVPPEKEGVVHLAGFAFLMFIGLIVAFNDVMKFF